MCFRNISLIYTYICFQFLNFLSVLKIPPATKLLQNFFPEYSLNSWTIQQLLLLSKNHSIFILMFHIHFIGFSIEDARGRDDPATSSRSKHTFEWYKFSMKLFDVNRRSDTVSYLPHFPWCASLINESHTNHKNYGSNFTHFGDFPIIWGPSLSIFYPSSFLFRKKILLRYRSTLLYYKNDWKSN